jgi:hypothetical protein
MRSTEEEIRQIGQRWMEAGGSGGATAASEDR